ncbi:MAG TPA: hypothetical protein VHS58_23685 [Acetobacteraceae bacterium]|nr:hypothetical protein [Acetobacteraceae bacterium]
MDATNLVSSSIERNAAFARMTCSAAAILARLAAIPATSVDELSLKVEAFGRDVDADSNAAASCWAAVVRDIHAVADKTPPAIPPAPPEMVLV